MVKAILDVPRRSKSNDFGKNLREAAFHAAAKGVVANLSARITAAAGSRSGEITLTVSGVDLEHLSIKMSGPEELIKFVNQSLASQEKKP